MAREIKEINVEIGRRIKEIRRAQGLTREELAALSGYSANFIQEVERGRSGLSSESIRAFSTALKISADSLLFGCEPTGFEHILRELKTVPPEKLKHIIKIIEESIECAK